MRRSGRAARFWAAAWLAVVALLLGGCVYVRLLELKHQLADFDRNFAVDTANGVTIVCRNPVLLSGDVRWIGLAPETTRTIGHAEEWQVRWIKQLPAGGREKAPFDIVVQLYFADDRLVRVVIPEKYFALMPKSFLLDLVRSLGGAKLNRESRSVEAQLAVSRPDLPAIEKLLGRPTSESDIDGRTTREYRYLPVAASRLAHAAVFDMRIVFDDTTGRMLYWQGKTPVGDIGFNFEKSEKPRP